MNGPPDFDDPDVADDPIAVPVWPTLSDDALQGNAGVLVGLVDPTTESDRAAVLASLLAMFGVWIGPGAHLHVANEHHPPLIWPMVIGGTTTGAKGTSYALVRHLFEQADPSFGDNIVSGLSSGEGLVERVRDEYGGPETKDFDEGVSDKRLLVFESEFSAVLARMARQGNTLGATLRDTWDSRPLGMMNRKSNTLRARTHHIGVIAHVTPGELLAKLEQSDLDGGTINRFLPVLSKRSRELPEGGNLPPEVIGKVAGILNDAKKAAQNGVYSRTDNASRLWRRHYGQLADGLGDRKEGLATARGRPQVLRLALIYTLLDARPAIGAEHMRAALALWRYVADSAVNIFADQDRRREDDELPKLLEFIGQAGDDGRTRENIRSDLYQRHKDARSIDRLLGRLIKAGKVDQKQESTSGRPRTVFTLRRDKRGCAI